MNICKTKSSMLRRMGFRGKKLEYQLCTCHSLNKSSLSRGHRGTVLAGEARNNQPMKSQPVTHGEKATRGLHRQGPESDRDSGARGHLSALKEGLSRTHCLSWTLTPRRTSRAERGQGRQAKAWVEEENLGPSKQRSGQEGQRRKQGRGHIGRGFGGHGQPLSLHPRRAISH